ncbi:16S rRNA (guanine(966)-N(2))-methyltransferase RsmD [Collinsella sp. AGMB00827]|uniref:16S rRNA (Guanine(966)-N(2))-methyltransferase RsmD n=1 Tax=Collinsella ureilytica TaxID=2869515 RepID=A0ABS7MK97_9ACTN|nr:16S rRNA (guanine(966)-N(2))-methyltransferase RsmD [Collinsella urealyticum]MBY4796820.1 16S rRNA (guanine(966)-N(2))-methyltransferase RsmD [Collinsella urealyticum]
MRVVGGLWRGRKIGEPRGKEVVRPTTDRVREAMASIVASALPSGIEGIRVLDAFAGSGALGIEMLSRGASSCVFCDINRSSAALIRANLTSLGADRNSYTILTTDAPGAAERGSLPSPAYDLVLLDPPYVLGTEPVVRVLSALAAHDLLVDGALALVERGMATAAAEVVGFERIREKRYGSTAVDVFRYHAHALPHESTVERG